MLELDDLLAPVSDDSPTGEDLSFSADFDRIQEFRRFDDPTLEQGEWQTDIKSADWPAALKASAELLRGRTKDLRLAGWYAEASTQVDGFAGLARGYRLVAGLCERYWDRLHPLAIDGDQEERIGNLGWLLGNSLQWLRTIPIVSAPQGRHGLEAFEVARARQASAEEGPDQPTLAQLEAMRADTPHDFYRGLLETIPDCLQALETLREAVDARLGMDGPSFSAVRERLELLQSTASRFAGDSGLLVEALAPAPGVAGTTAEATAAPAASRAPGGAPSTRRDALVQLRQVAEFFRRTEPHSPVAYLAEKAARWGEMPLHVWLRRVIKDDSVLHQMEEMLDVEQDQNGGY